MQENECGHLLWQWTSALQLLLWGHVTSSSARVRIVLLTTVLFTPRFELLRGLTPSSHTWSLDKRVLSTTSQYSSVGRRWAHSFVFLLLWLNVWETATKGYIQYVKVWGRWVETAGTRDGSSHSVSSQEAKSKEGTSHGGPRPASRELHWKKLASWSSLHNLSKSLQPSQPCHQLGSNVRLQGTFHSLSMSHLKTSIKRKATHESSIPRILKLDRP